MRKPKLGNLFDRKASVQLKVFLSLAIFGIASALLIGMALAATFSPTAINLPVAGSNFSTSIPTINVSTTGNTNCTYNITNSSGSFLNGAITPDNAASHQITSVSISSLADGAYNVTVFCMNATDSTDNETNYSAFTKDATPPSVGTAYFVPSNQFYSGSPNYVGYGGSIYANITASASDSTSGIDTATCEYTTDGGSNWLAASWNGTHCYKALNAGVHDTSYTYNIRVKDKAGSYGTGTSITATLDTNNPSGSKAYPADGSWTNSSVNLAFNPTDSGSGLKNCDLYWDYPAHDTVLLINKTINSPTDSDVNWFNFTGLTTEGTYTWDVACYDNVAWSGWTDSYVHRTFKIDNTAPTISWNTPSNGSYVSGTITLNATVTDTGSGLSITGGFNSTCGGNFGSLIFSPLGGGLYYVTTTWNTTFLGNCTLNLTVTDGVGHTSYNDSIYVTVGPSCGRTLTSSTTLNGDLTGCTDSGLIINTSNVVLDCAGHKIGGNYTGGTGHGINVTADNVTIKNCTIYGFNGTGMAGVYSGTGNNGTVMNSTFYDNYIAIKVYWLQNYWMVLNNTILNGTYEGIYVAGSNSLIQGNIIKNVGSQYGIDVTSDGYDTIQNNFVNNSGKGISIGNGAVGNNVLKNNTITYSAAAVGVYIADTYSWDIENNTIAYNYGHGLELNSGNVTNKLVFHNNIYNNSMGVDNQQVTSVDAINLDNGSSGNYWGHSICPVFNVSDSNAANVVDRFPYENMSGWALGQSPTQCAPVINEFEINGGTNISLNIADLSAPQTYELEVNITNTSAAGVNLTHNGICMGPDNTPLYYNASAGLFTGNCTLNVTNAAALPSSGSSVNITAVAYYFGSSSSSSANVTFYYDFERPVIHFNWWYTYDQDYNNVTLPQPKNFTSDADAFYSPADNTIHFAVNVTDNNNVTSVVVNTSEIADFEHSLSPSGGCTGDIPLSYSSGSGLWEGSCGLGDFNKTDIETFTGGNPVAGFNFYIITYDNYSNPSAPVYNITIDPPQEVANPSSCISGGGLGQCMPTFALVMLQDFGIPNPENGTPCINLGASSTNFSDSSQVSDFSNVNFILQINVSLSCLYNSSDLPSDFITVALFNFTSLDFSNPGTSAKLSQLNQAINFNFIAPNNFGSSRIYVNTTFFRELNTNSTITMYHLPFMEQPNITGDPGAAGIDSGSIIWTAGPDDVFNGSTTGNLTFEVYGFSGYNISDTVVPIINITAPVNGATYNTNSTLFNFTVNGTGTEPSTITLRLAMIGGNTRIFTFYNTPGHSNLNCTPITSNNETWRCLQNVSTADGIYNATFVANDFGGSQGNVKIESLLFTVDTTPPVMSAISASDITNDTFRINVTTNENATCFVQLGTNTSYEWYNTTPTTGMGGHSHGANVLEPGTLYHYRWNCTDLFNNSALSSDYTFITAVIQNETFNASTTQTITFNITDNGTNKTIAEFEINTVNDTNATIEVLRVDTNPEGVNLSKAAGIYIVINSTELNTSTLNWVVIKVYYNRSALPRGVDESALRLYLFSGGAWVKIEPGGVNTTAQYVWGNVTHFSTYAIGGQSVQVQQTGNGGTPGVVLTSGQNYTLDLSTINNRTLVVGDMVSFVLDGIIHTAKVISLTANSVTLQINSTPFNVIINVGQTKLVDVNGDGTNDISVYLQKIEFGRTYLTFTGIAAPSQPTTQPPAQPGAEQPAAPGAQQPAAPGAEQPAVAPAVTDNTTIIVLAVALVIVAAIIVWWYRNRI